MALAFIELLRRPGQIYQGADMPVRRDLLAALFRKLLVYVHEDQVTVNSARTRANSAVRGLYGQQLAHGATRAPGGPEKAKTPGLAAGGSENTHDLANSSLVHGLSNVHVAGMEGFEPPNARTKTWCLTTWPHPNKKCSLGQTTP